MENNGLIMFSKVDNNLKLISKTIFALFRTAEVRVNLRGIWLFNASQCLVSNEFMKN